MPERSYGVANHDPDCQCKVCLRIRRAIDAGIPSKRDRVLAAQERRAKRQERELEREKAKLVRRGAIAAASAVSLAMGKELDPKLRDAISENAPMVVKEERQGNIYGKTDVTLERFIQTSLTSAGVDLEKLASVSAGGLDATLVKTATFEGEISDEKTYIDWPTRHKYLETMLRIYGFLKSDDAPPQMGGLVIVNASEFQKRNTAHPFDCPCDDCNADFASAMRSAHRYQKTREANANILDVPTSLAPVAPVTNNSQRQDEDEDE